MAGRCPGEVLFAGHAGDPICGLSALPHSSHADVFQFLDRDPSKRLGHRPGGGGFQDLKAHPWFHGIDWQAIYNKEVVPPFEPDVRFPSHNRSIQLMFAVKTSKLRCDA